MTICDSIDIEKLRILTDRCVKRRLKKKIEDEKQLKKKWLSEEKKEAEKIISSIHSVVEQEAKKGKNLAFIMYLDREGELEIIRGYCLENLNGAGKIVGDWCLKQGFKISVGFHPGPCNDGSSYLYVSW